MTVTTKHTVSASTREQPIIPIATFQPVRATIAHQQVSANTTLKQIGIVATSQCVVARAAAKNVEPGAAQHAVIAAPAINRVIASAALQVVIPVITIDLVVTSKTNERIVVIGPHKVVLTRGARYGYRLRDQITKVIPGGIIAEPHTADQSGASGVNHNRSAPIQQARKWCVIITVFYRVQSLNKRHNTPRNARDRRLQNATLGKGYPCNGASYGVALRIESKAGAGEGCDNARLRVLRHDLSA